MRKVAAHVVAIALTLVVGWLRPSPGDRVGAGAAGAASFAVRRSSDGRTRPIAPRGNAIYDGDRLLAGALEAGASDGIGGAARFASPAAVVRGRGGATLFVADTGNGMVRAIDLASATVSTLAAGLGAPSALSYDADAELLYVLDGQGLVAIDVRRAVVTALE